MTTPFPGFAPARGVSTPQPGLRPRVLFYCPEVPGLGHLRRMLAIVGELAQRRPDAALLGLVGHPQIEAYDLPPNFDYVRLPSFQKGDLYRGLPTGAAAHGVVPLRQALVRRLLESYAPRILLVDYTLAGAAGELRDILLELRVARPRPTLVHLFREIDNEPRLTVTHQRQSGLSELLDHVYDHILVVGSREVFDP